MKKLPPPMLVKTWFFIISSKEEDMDYQKLKLREEIKDLFGSIELAQLYIEQLEDDDIDVYFI